MRLESYKRVDDHTFSIKIEGHEERLTIDVSSIEMRNRQNVITGLFKDMSAIQYSHLIKDEHQQVSINGKIYVIDKAQTTRNILSRITNFVLKDDYVDVIRLKLTPDRMHSIGLSPDRSIKKIEINPTPNLLVDEPPWKSDSKAMLIKEKNEEKKQPFFDPYTQLAAHAFQTMHEDFAQNKSGTSQFVVRMKSLGEDTDLFVLSTKSDPLASEFLPNSSIVQMYRESLVEQWGEEKVNLLQHRYGISFKDMQANEQPLTIDIIYAMNIGLGQFEMEDILSSHRSLIALHNTLSSLNDDMLINDCAGELNMNSFLLNRFLFEITNSNTPNPTIKDALNWFNTHAYLINQLSTDQLLVNHFEILMRFNQLTEEEQSQKYTGRKMGGFVDSAYTLADGTKYLPWLDDQELSECNERLIGNKSWDYFTQQLAFIVCKKHLMHTHPTKDYYVGTLIPAPVGENGQEWYRVTSCINSGTGNLSYTLEPTAVDSQLPAIKLFRSTASAAYSFDSEASVKSDINPLNAPGYEGQIIVEKYEKDFFLERTVPFWVGYQYAAEQKIQQLIASPAELNAEKCEAVQNFLEGVTKSWFDDEKNLSNSQTLSDLIRRYDWIILDYVKKASLLGLHEGELSANEYFKMRALIKKYGYRVEERVFSSKEQVEDAHFLMKMLSKNPFGKRIELITLLEESLKKIDQPPNTTFQPGNDDFSSITRLQQNYLKNKEKGLPPQALLPLLADWSHAINQIAMNRDEAVSQKKKQKLMCVGHSLGGALAQRTFAKYTLLQGRMPVPSEKAELYDFAAPAINSGDNQIFMQNGNKHSSLLQHFNKPLEINRWQMVGDFVPLGGAIHLGATFNNQQRTHAADWLNFNAHVVHPHQNATSPSVVDSMFTHGLQGLQPVYGEESVSKTFQEIIALPYDTYTQGQFNLGDAKIRKQIWHIDSLVDTFIELEKNSGMLRTALRTAVLFGSPYAQKPEPLHGPWYQHTDEDGVFVVNQQGVEVY